MGQRNAVRRLVAGSLAVAVGVTCTAAPAALAGERTQDRERNPRAIVEELTESGVPGAMIYGGDRARSWSVSSGTARLGTERPIRAKDKVRVASNTKMFVATVVLQLAGEGKVDLDEPIESYVPGIVRGNGHDGTTITVRQLLRHTSGLPDYVADLIGDPGNAERTWRPEELIAIALEHPPLFEPGTDWAYSNTGYLLLGMLVERVTGNDVGSEITGRLITPLGLRQTSYPEPGETRIRGPHAHGYYAFPGEPLTDVTELEPSLSGASGSLVSTGPDLTRFLTALLSGKLLAPELLAEMRETVPAGNYDYGLGIGEIPLPCGGVAWGHSGNMPGYDTFSAATEDGRAAFVVANGPMADGESADLIPAMESALCR
ncbi:serine hydrolase domain-containing protein [Saccharomonospora sp. NPDC006951]